MGRVASAANNAAIELFHSLLQTNVLNSRRWETHEELLAMVTRIEKNYHRQRRKHRLGRMTPVEFEVLNGALQTA